MYRRYKEKAAIAAIGVALSQVLPSVAGTESLSSIQQSTKSLKSDVYINLYYGNTPPVSGLISEIKSKFPKLGLILIKHENRYRLLGESEAAFVDLSKVSASKVLDTEPFLWSWSTLPEDISVTLKESNNFEQIAAETAVSLGEIGQSNDKSEAVQNKIQSEVKSYVKREGARVLNDKLSYFGTSEVGFELYDDFRLLNGHAELLVPFGGDATTTYFTQGGVVINSNDQYSGRDFAHIGLGYRAQIGDELMYGVNSFYDLDLQRKHQRGSLGGEFWYQNYKVSGNYYFPLSGWKKSNEQFENVGLYYLTERAARGLDIKGEGYLPNNPSISADIGVGMNFGRLVEVSDGSNPVSIPYKVEANLHYQPIPLVRLSGGYSHEKGRGGEGTVGLELIYNFGQSPSEQMKRTNVAQTKELSRQLTTSMVSRNNNITLEYKEQAFAFMLKKNYVEVEPGSLLSASSLVNVTGPKNVASYEMVVKGGSASVKSSRQSHSKLVDESLHQLQYAIPQDSTYSQSEHIYEVTIVANLKGNRQPVVSPPITVVVKPSDTSALVVTTGGNLTQKANGEYVLKASVQEGQPWLYAFPETSSDNVKWVSSGPDASNFRLSETGVRTRSKDFEYPMDNDEDNIYVFTLTGTDSTTINKTVTVEVALTVTDDVSDNPSSGDVKFTVTERGFVDHRSGHIFHSIEVAPGNYYVFLSLSQNKSFLMKCNSTAIRVLRSPNIQVLSSPSDISGCNVENVFSEGQADFPIVTVASSEDPNFSATFVGSQMPFQLLVSSIEVKYPQYIKGL